MRYQRFQSLSKTIVISALLSIIISPVPAILSSYEVIINLHGKGGVKHYNITFHISFSPNWYLTVTLFVPSTQLFNPSLIHMLKAISTYQLIKITCCPFRVQQCVKCIAQQTNRKPWDIYWSRLCFFIPLSKCNIFFLSSPNLLPLHTERGQSVKPWKTTSIRLSQKKDFH